MTFIRYFKYFINILFLLFYKIIDNNTENEFCIEQRYESTTTDLDIRKNETAPDQHNINMDNKTCSSLSQTSDYTISKEVKT